MKIRKSCERKKREYEIYVIFTWDKYDKILRKVFNGKDECDIIHFPAGNKTEKLNLFFSESPW